MNFEDIYLRQTLRELAPNKMDLLAKADCVSFDSRGATSILGRQVSGPDDKNVGRIVDVLVDDLGQPRAAVVDVGGFLGIGNRRIAVVWRALHFAPEATGVGKIRLEMTADQIKATPEYKAISTPVVVAAPPRTERTPP